MKLIGLEKIVEEIKILKQKNSVFPHTLLVGPRGVGKTTISRYVSQLVNKETYFTTGATLDKTDLFRYLTMMTKGDILIIDEIHRLNKRVEEMLYSVLQDNNLIINRYAQPIEIEEITIIGITTRPSMLSKPLLSRFRVKFEILHYTQEQLTLICKEHYPVFTFEECKKIAECCFVPRDVVNLAYRISNLDFKTIDEKLRFLGYKKGLSEKERRYLEALKIQTVGLKTLEGILQIHEDEIRYVEDRLLWLGLIEITNKGRQLTPKGYRVLRELNNDD